MKKLEWMSGLSLVALLLVSCTGNPKLSQAPKLQPSVDKVPEAPITPNPDFTKLISRLRPPDLSPNTDRTKLNFATGRDDPFAAVVVTPIKQPQSNQSKTEFNKSNQSKTELNKPNQSKTELNKPNQSKTELNKPNQSKTELNKPNQSIPSDEFGTKPSQINPIPVPKPHAPLVPSTELAKAVQVSGVMDVGGRVTAIVKESKENTSLSVSEGDYISNGAVRVKRIQLSSNNQPLVILEQNGVEVIKPISSGNGPIASNSLVP